MNTATAQKTINYIGIDVETKDVEKLIAELKLLSLSTISVTDGGAYSEDANFSQVHLETTLTEKEVEDWLYATQNINYVGTWTLCGRQPSPTIRQQ